MGMTGGAPCFFTTRYSPPVRCFLKSSSSFCSSYYNYYGKVDQKVGVMVTRTYAVSNHDDDYQGLEKHKTSSSSSSSSRSSNDIDRNKEEEKKKNGYAMALDEGRGLKMGKGIKDFFEESKVLIASEAAAPPRWFSPVDVFHNINAPLLLYLPGIDGVGLGLIRHHHSLRQMFNLWCLHIPVKDRTSFLELVKLVEKRVKSENQLFPDRPIYIIAESLGACIALAVAASNPDLDLVLILSNPGTCFEKSQLQHLMSLLDLVPNHYQFTLPYLQVTMIGGTDFFSLGDLVKASMDTLAKGNPVQEAVAGLSKNVLSMSCHLSILRDILPRETFQWKLKLLQSAAAWVNARLHTIKAQTLILHSGKDQFLPSQDESQRLCRSLSRCDHRGFTESGHFLFLEEGFDLAKTIKGAAIYRRGKQLDWVSDYIQLSPSEFCKIYEDVKEIVKGTSPVMVSTLEDGTIVRGLAGVPSEAEGPVLYVGYHMLLGFELVPLVAQFLYEKGILLRGMAHSMLFSKRKNGILPDISFFDKIRVMGAVPVTGSNFYKLMSSKSHALLYPGGAREACHRKGEEYQLFWPEQTEFVRMAARFGATIVPFGAVGEDDVAQLILDYEEQMGIPLVREYIQILNAEVFNVRSKVKGEVQNQDVHFPVFCPKPPGRFYFYFGKPINTKGKDELKDRKKAQQLYLEIKSQVEHCLAFLKEKRQVDPYRFVWARLAYQAVHGFDSEIPTFNF